MIITSEIPGKSLLLKPYYVKRIPAYSLDVLEALRTKA